LLWPWPQPSARRPVPATTGPRRRPRAPAEWVRVGLDLANTRAAAGETALAPDTVAGLAPAWDVRGLRGVSGTPLVRDGRGSMPGWVGTLTEDEIQAVVDYERTVLAAGP
jgi:hypothetical protein